MARKAADKVGLVLRFEEALRRRIERAAKAHNRSMNSEIVERLRESFRKDDRTAELEALAERAVRKMSAADRAAEQAGREAAEADSEALKEEGEK